MFITKDDKIKYLENRLATYERFFTIIKGTVHVRGKFEDGHSISIGKLIEFYKENVSR